MKKFILPLLMFLLGQANSVQAAETDLTAIDNVIYIMPTSVSPETKATLSICMKNTAEIRGFQFDLYLPEGVTAAVNNKGRIMCTLSKDRLEDGDEHTLTLQKQDDGSIRFLCGSQYDETFTGNEGEIATMEVDISTNMKEGSYPVILKNVKLSETDISKFYLTDEVETTINIVPVGISCVLTNEESDAPVYNLAGQRLNGVRKGINIIKGKKTVVR